MSAPLDIAPFLGRLVLAASASDEQAFQLAVEDAHRAGISPIQLLVITAQSLASHMDITVPDWQDEVRLGLLEAQDKS
ncbi:hypothetical protein E3N86_13420 [Cryobacterium sp. Hz7]|uniref:hypothetical protein n=1 Tax=Cryobacterium sp. Hz7 TaxID=1259166 RepID=UPI00106B0E4A|nr:hypothetical protein [Cryobacterium sp. Hz7]TFB58706.1 hypothetical protein E3N86_13420 [Cryobacterium sp. Hz7]